jgi:hypothetical protein
VTGDKVTGDKVTRGQSDRDSDRGQSERGQSVRIPKKFPFKKIKKSKKNAEICPKSIEEKSFPKSM